MYGFEPALDLMRRLRSKLTWKRKPLDQDTIYSNHLVGNFRCEYYMIVITEYGEELTKCNDTNWNSQNSLKRAPLQSLILKLPNWNDANRPQAPWSTVGCQERR